MKDTKCFAALAAVLAVLMLVGCGKSETPPGQPAAPAPQPEQPPQTEQVVQQELPSKNVSMATGSTVRVASTRELLESIAPGAEIVIEPGYYNMSDHLDTLWAQEGEHWNDTHPYVQLVECYDGVELLIQGVWDMSITGGGAAAEDTELVIDARYGAVLNFLECSELELSKLTMGHTKLSGCAGNVLNFSACTDIRLNGMDLYGCGVYGIGCYNGTGELYAHESTIRSCSCGPLEIYDGDGRFEFRDCWLVDSDGYAWYEGNPNSELAFYGCIFDDNETSYFMFLEDVYTEDCIWSENYVYPDVEPGFDVNEVVGFDPEALTPAAVDRQFLGDTAWTGHCMVNPESGETVYLPYDDVDETHVAVILELYPDGSGWFSTGHEFGYITWVCDGTSCVWIEMEDGRTYYITPYAMGTEDDSAIWLLLELEECLVWLY